jgi:hypothetical protein
MFRYLLNCIYSKTTNKKILKLYFDFKIKSVITKHILVITTETLNQHNFRIVNQYNFFNNF